MPCTGTRGRFIYVTDDLNLEHKQIIRYTKLFIALVITNNNVWSTKIKEKYIII